MIRLKPALAFVFIVVLLDTLGFGLIVPVMPKLLEQIQGGDTQTAARSLGWLGALYSVMQLAFSPILGSLSDRFGRRPVLLLSLLGGAIDYLVLAWAPTVGWLYLGRVVSGITAANIIVANAYLADVTTPEKRAEGFSMIGAAVGLGLILGPSIGGLLGGYGLRVPFLVAGGLTLLNWIYGAFVLPESLKPEHRRAIHWKEANPFKALPSLRRWPQVGWLASALFLQVLGYQASTYLWVLYTETRFGWDSMHVGLSVALVGILVAIVQGGLAGRIVGSLGERRSVQLGLLATSAALFGYGAATAGWMLYFILGLGALGSIGAPMIKAVISQAVPPDEQGSVQGALSSITSIADIVAPPLWTFLFSWSIAQARPLPGLTFFAAGLVVLVATVLSAAGRAPGPRPADAEQSPR